jgi:hypothetical protein
VLSRLLVTIQLPAQTRQQPREDLTMLHQGTNERRPVAGALADRALQTSAGERTGRELTDVELEAVAAAGKVVFVGRPAFFRFGFFRRGIFIF